MGKLKTYLVELKERNGKKFFEFLPDQEQAGLSLNHFQLLPTPKGKKSFKKALESEIGAIWSCCRIRRSSSKFEMVCYADSLFEPGNIFEK